MIYLLFAGEDYRSYGGIWDLKAFFGTMEEARAAGSQELSEWGGYWAHIVTVGDGVLKLALVNYGKLGWTEPAVGISCNLEAA